MLDEKRFEECLEQFPAHGDVAEGIDLDARGVLVIARAPGQREPQVTREQQDERGEGGDQADDPHGSASKKAGQARIVAQGSRG